MAVVRFDPPPAWRDRSTTVSFIGLGTIGLGVLVAGLAVMMFFMPFPGLAMAGILYMAASAVLLVIGIGLMRVRKWARALMLILCWFWLLSGSMATVLMAVILGSSKIPAVILVGILSATFYAVFLILLPGILIWILRSDDVRLTCEAHDPVVRWTDGRPLAVTGVALYMILFGLYALVLPFGPEAPQFGVYLTGPLKYAVPLALAAAWIASGAGFLRMKPWAWWATLLVTILGGVSALLTAIRIPLDELYRRSGLTEVQIEQAKQFGMKNVMFWGLAGTLVMLGLLIWLRRHFTRPVQGA